MLSHTFPRPGWQPLFALANDVRFKFDGYVGLVPSLLGACALWSLERNDRKARDECEFGVISDDSLASAPFSLLFALVQQISVRVPNVCRYRRYLQPSPQWHPGVRTTQSYRCLLALASVAVWRHTQIQFASTD